MDNEIAWLGSVICLLAAIRQIVQTDYSATALFVGVSMLFTGEIVLNKMAAKKNDFVNEL